MIKRILLAQLWLLVAVAVIAVAVVEFRAHGTQGIAGFSIADRLAEAEVQNQPAPTFSIGSLDGGTVSLDALRGHIVVLNFWATWCAPCQREAPAFSVLSREYAGRGVRFLGMNERDDRYAAQDFMRAYRLGYPSGFDPAGSLAGLFGLWAMPTTFVIDPDGVIRYRFIGYLDEPTLRQTIETLLGSGQ